MKVSLMDALGGNGKAGAARHTMLVDPTHSALAVAAAARNARGEPSMLHADGCDMRGTGSRFWCCFQQILNQEFHSKTGNTQAPCLEVDILCRGRSWHLSDQLLFCLHDWNWERLAMVALVDIICQEKPSNSMCGPRDDVL